MHPAFSVILFTTLTGSGYGLLALLGLQAAWRPALVDPRWTLVALGFALVLVTTGLVASLWHLGQPQRAWRALSQWRSSWLSREGVVAVVTYAPALALAWCVWQGEVSYASRALGLLLSAASLATVACTAMIYASLPPIPAWRDRAVVPAYLGYALFGGALWLGALLALGGTRPDVWLGIGVFVLAIALGALKLGYWRRIDAPRGDPTLADAIGLPGIGTVRSFERPHTESNYLLNEMGFVLARRHGRRLRVLALLLGIALPLALAAISALNPTAAALWLLLAALVFQLGALLERWLFFAQARHLVTLYYGVGDGGD